MNAAHNRIFFAFLGPVAAVMVAGCTSGVLGSATSTPAQGIELRVATLEACPKAGGGSRSETALPAALGGALVPAIIDTGVTAIDGLLQDAAGQYTKTVTARTVSQFYSSSPMPQNGPEAFEVQKNRANGCVVLAYGPMWSNTPSQEFTGVYFSGTDKRTLKKRVGLQGNPYFYYEGRFVYSMDLSAFRIESAVIKYDRTIADGTSGFRNIALEFKFSLPHTADSGNAFAVGKIPLELIYTGTTLQGSPDIGTSSATKYSTPWMPLPPLNENTRAMLAHGKAASENLKLTINRLKGIYVSRVDPTAEDTMDRIGAVSTTHVETFLGAVDQKKVTKTLKSIDAGIDMLSDQIGRKTMRLDDAIIALNLKLVKERRGLEGVEAIEYARDARMEVLEARSELTRKREKLKLYIGIKSDLTALKKAKDELYLILTAIKVIEAKLKTFVPFTIAATIAEKRSVHPMRKFFADIFSSAKPSVTRELKSALDPKARHELEEQKKAAEEARQDNFNMLRRNAVLAALEVRGAEITLRLLGPNTDEIQRHTAEVKLRTAVFEAVDACQKAVRKSAQPVECAPYL